MKAIGDFAARLAASVDRQQSLLAVRLAPDLDQPSATPGFRNRNQLDALQAWYSTLIAQTQPYVCAYLLESASFEVLGEAGERFRRALRRATPPTIPLIWDGRRSDVGPAATRYATACLGQWGMDAITLNPLAGADSVRPYAAFAQQGCFVVCATANPTAAAVQALEISDWQTLDREPNQPLAVHLARQAIQWHPHCGLLISGQSIEQARLLRANATDRWLLLDAGSSAPNPTVASAVAWPSGGGVLVDDGGVVAAADDPAATADQLRIALMASR
jgi:orotidine 5'-phosphate decarboxylase subfamily 2